MSANDQSGPREPDTKSLLRPAESLLAKFLRSKQMKKRSPGSDASLEIHFAGSLIGLAAIQGNR
jgi:hypothetical protein